MGAADVVHFPWEGPEMEDAEKSHFDTQKKGGDSHFDVGVGDLWAGLDGAGGCEERDDNLL